MKRLSARALLPIVLFAAAYLLVLGLVPNRYYQLILILVPIWAVLGISWNIISGYSGLMSFGHGAFFGLGAYTVAIGMTTCRISPWIGIPLATAVGAVAALAIGLPTFRLRGHYFALAMLAYPLGILYVFEWLGFQEVAVPMMRDNPVAYMQFADYRVYGAIAIAVLAFSLALSVWIERSRFGLSLMAIKQNEIAAQASGIDAMRWKMKAICVSGAMAGGIGGFYAVILLIVTPQSVFGMLISAQALIVTLFGGVGAAWGPVIGAMILIPLSETLYAEFGSALPGISGVVYGIALIAIILAAPEGLYWKFRDLLLKKTVPAGPAEAARAAGRRAVERMPRGIEGGRALLEVHDVCKSFGGLKAVKNVSFTIPEGAVVGIIGPNGAGKTTLFNLLNGIYRMDSGRVVLDGRELAGLGPSAICRAGVGRTFQVVRPFRRLSVLQNVVVGAYVAADDDAAAERLACAALAQVGLSDAADLIAGGLSSKQLRLMELARALAGQPRLLLLDETLAGLGSEEVEDLLGVVAGLAERGLTVVIIEHTMQAMVRLADHFIVLDNGAVLCEGAPKDVVQNKAVVEAYLGKKWIAAGA
jgi:ABC-type branched-subunit amino acid transport system ATPase component/ABC-type branched-subunit amino acid transport system permease subunit